MKKILLFTLLGLAFGAVRAANSYFGLANEQETTTAFIVGYLGGKVLVWTLIGTAFGAAFAFATRRSAKAEA